MELRAKTDAIGTKLEILVAKNDYRGCVGAGNLIAMHIANHDQSQTTKIKKHGSILYNESMCPVKQHRQAQPPLSKCIINHIRPFFPTEPSSPVITPSGHHPSGHLGAGIGGSTLRAGRSPSTRSIRSTSGMTPPGGNGNGRWPVAASSDEMVPEWEVREI